MSCGRVFSGKTTVIDVYDDHIDPPQHITTVTTDGSSGCVQVETGAERWDSWLNNRFGRPRVTMVAGGSVAGACVDAVRTQPAWAAATIEAVLEEDLPRLRLRGDIRRSDSKHGLRARIRSSIASVFGHRGASQPRTLANSLKALLRNRHIE